MCVIPPTRVFGCFPRFPFPSQNIFAILCYMPGSRESSVWRTLAVAFGDGLAFGVGLTLTNNAARTATAKTPQPYPDIRPLAERLTEIEQRIERAGVAPPVAVPAATVNGANIAKVAEAVLTAMDGRFSEIGEQMERRLAELEGKFKSELEAVEARAQHRKTGAEAHMDALRIEFTGALEAQRLRSDSDLRVLRSQIMEVHKEFAETLARLVDEQIEHTIALRLQAIQEQVRETVREESLSAYAKFGEGVEAVVETRFQAAHEEWNRNGRQILELGARLDTHEHNLLDLVIALGRNCLQSAERMTPTKAPANGGGGSGSETHIAAAGIYEVPSFARQAPPKHHWRIPAVSCFLMATTGLLALHILVV